MDEHNCSCQPCGRKLFLGILSIGFLLGITFVGTLSLGFLFGVTFYVSRSLETDIGQHLRATNSINALPSEDADANVATYTDSAGKKISLVTSLWAKHRHPDIIIPHRREVEAALLANIYNPHIDQVVIFLDSIMTAIDEGGHGPSTCFHFHQDMDELNRQFREASPPAPVETHSADPMSKVICVGLNSGQPNYHQMFSQAISDIVTGDIVVMANADMAFDDTLEQARKLKEDVLLVLGTKGFTEEMPLSTRHVYDVVVGVPADDVNTDRDMCMSNPWSWDSWIFHKKSIQGNNLKEEDFLRPTIKGNDHKAPFFMNESSAENAALWAMEQSPGFNISINACELIHSWSFHLTPKTHHKYGEKSIWPHPPYVPRPHGGTRYREKINRPFPPKGCDRPGGCFYD